MVKDALTTSHPVSTPIATPDDIAESFDSISYSKVKHFSQTYVVKLHYIHYVILLHYTYYEI